MHVQEFYKSTLVRDGLPLSNALVRATGALCPDGIRRTAFASFDGIADTFFSVPAYVHARHEGKSVRVYGYVTTGRALPEDEAETVKFVPYLYRKHFASVCHPAREDENVCLHCGKQTETNGSLSNRVHIGSDFLCDVIAYRRDGYGTHAEVRATQSYQVRTYAETLPVTDREAELVRVHTLLCGAVFAESRQAERASKRAWQALADETEVTS